MSVISNPPTINSTIPEDSILKVDSQDTARTSVSTNSKYGEMKKFLSPGTRKVNTYPSSLAPRSRRCSENWDSDFDIDCRVLKIPTNVRSSSDLANKDSSNFRNLSEKKIVLRDLVRRIKLKASKDPERANDTVGATYAQDLQEAEALVQHLHEDGTKGLDSEVSDIHDENELAKKAKHKILENNEVFKTLLSRTRPPSPITPDGCSLASDSSTSQDSDSVYFHFTPDVLPPLLDKMDALILRLTEYLDYIEW